MARWLRNTGFAFYCAVNAGFTLFYFVQTAQNPVSAAMHRAVRQYETLASAIPRGSRVCLYGRLAAEGDALAAAQYALPGRASEERKLDERSIPANCYAVLSPAAAAYADLAPIALARADDWIVVRGPL